MSYLICGTGAIAQALARRLKDRASSIVVAGRSVDKMTDVACKKIEVDFGRPGEVSAALAGNLPSDLKGMAYCVGSAVMKPFRGVRPDECVEAFNLNAVSAIETVRGALPELKKNKGSVVLFSSIAVQRGFANHLTIGASKGAVEGIARSLAAELAPSVRVNAIAPSLTTGAAITAPLTSNEKTAEKIAAAHPLGRLGTPDDSAALAALLLADDASWITGHVFGVDGGRAAIIR
ncbi:hypothetical protein CTAYLR_000210 [Chrysophaeum taylorii]|uniref:Uncharacterized protein n=1 Tax=Chrysophaeum taylorii TaxID=2483200 RepID=A0AAD7UF52_9STRA|nr:hypothetical protein CTAYLR_000210 [Chrysophaeum taylorii]